MDNPVTQASLSAERFDLRHHCHTQGRELAVIIGTINEKPFTNVIPNQPTILYYGGNGTPLQYSGHLMRRVDSLEKTLMLGGIGGSRRRGR